MRSSLSIAVAGMLALSGCASLPKIPKIPKLPGAVSAQAPAAALPASFTQTKTLPITNVTSDAVLADLLARVPQSPDIEIAQSRLVEARARFAAAQAGLMPSVTGTSSIGAASAKATGGNSSASIGTSLEYPLDLFGAGRGWVEATRARAEAAAYTKDRTDALTRATLSQLYVALRTAQTQIAVTRANEASATDSLSLATTRQRAGLETGLGVAQATSNRDAIAARLPGFQQAQTASRLGIEGLLGLLPGSLQAQLDPAKAIPAFDLSRADIAPDQWLANRADLQAAARRLQAAGLEAGAAKRDRYPNLSLSAVLGATGASSGPTGLAGSLSGNLLSTLFDFGRLDALAKAAGAVAQTEAALYRQNVVNALADVETQASRVSRGQDAITANNANIASAQDQARLARVRYTSGLSAFLEVLTAERAVYEAQSAQVQATGETALAQVALNLALGY
jgi:outer membrane protein, multidrug efflux system